jgi:hypothetical protein
MERELFGFELSVFESKVLVPVKISQFQDMGNENRFRGHSKRPIKHVSAFASPHPKIAPRSLNFVVTANSRWRMFSRKAATKSNLHLEKFDRNLENTFCIEAKNLNILTCQNWSFLTYVVMIYPVYYIVYSVYT